MKKLDPVPCGNQSSSLKMACGQLYFILTSYVAPVAEPLYCDALGYYPWRIYHEVMYNRLPDVLYTR
jgi:hypothetical protein